MTSLRAVIEAMLFVADGPTTAERLRDAAGDVTLQAVEESLRSLAAELEQGRGIRLVQVDGAWRLRTADEVAPWLRAFADAKPVKLSRAALETLAIVAYRQPCTRSDIERVRGSGSGGVLRALLDRKLLRVAGRRDLPGKPIVYATSALFLDTLGLTSLGDLPSLREFTELGPEDIEAVRDLLGDSDSVEQVTFQEYAARRALAEVDAAVDDRLAARGSLDS